METIENVEGSNTCGLSWQRMEPVTGTQAAVIRPVPGDPGADDRARRCQGRVHKTARTHAKSTACLSSLVVAIPEQPSGNRSATGLESFQALNNGLFDESRSIL